jgi:hypothetical protein
VEAINKILLKLVGLKISFAVEMIHILLNLVISGFLARFVGVCAGMEVGGRKFAKFCYTSVARCLVTLKTLFLLSES